MSDRVLAHRAVVRGGIDPGQRAGAEGWAAGRAAEWAAGGAAHSLEYTVCGYTITRLHTLTHDTRAHRYRVVGSTPSITLLHIHEFTTYEMKKCEYDKNLCWDQI